MVVVISRRLLNVCCFLLEASVWWLLFPRGFWMVVVISRRLLNGCSYRLEASEQLLLFPGGC